MISISIHFQHVQVSHAMTEDAKLKASLLFAHPSSILPALGPDGNPLKTSVCDEIEESVKRAAQIEKQLQHSKVLYL